ncbi:ABC transporter ATP-binding protein [Aureitalea marina]|uniref:ABC transporter ATP-binding protein n=1 Tax=Aureitalea marina TaxID=930804 RepID=A0A2S7KS67_9FLAO|nr:ABC transporter ATP-binding protein [Aureitalea marina]PQB05418.1 ABC transporter ATP-binding protein [Aureitalea marina]
MLNVDIISFGYGEAEVLSKIKFDLHQGDHLAVLGESGCGKTSLLHLIYGLLDLPQGKISWNGQALLGPRFNLVPGEDFIKLVAQEFNVMPHITVAENVATYLPRLDADQDMERVLELLEVVDLADQRDQMVRDLSGGQKQRVAIAKALAKQPEILLLDEPFSHIDTFRKNKLRRQLYGYLKQRKISCITATHESEEALAFADELLIIKDGTVDIHGATQTVYKQLDNHYRASFFGEVSSIPASYLNKSEGDFLFYLPHQIKIAQDENGFHAIVVNSYFKGSHFLIEAKADGNLLYFQHSHAMEVGSHVLLKVERNG